MITVNGDFIGGLQSFLQESWYRIKEKSSTGFKEYGYHGFWNNSYSFLREDELESVTQPSESILFVSDVRLYKNDYGKAKIDFTWSGLRYPMKGVSLTDQGFYDKIDDEEICYKYAIIIISIPKDADWTHPETGERRAYKFVSKVFGSNN